ncbi:MAG: twin-arginine translocase subunit TatC, partial [Nitrospiria bacterium]
MKAEEDQAGNMPLMEHLSELRRRLIVIAAGVLVAAAGAFSFSDQILHMLTAPLGTDLYFLAPTEAFWVSLKISLVAG